MSTATLTGDEVHMREAVMCELEADPRLDASGIGVTAAGEAIVLSGFVDTFYAKLAAERAAKRVRGVRAVANDIEVRRKLGRADDHIARDAARALELRSTVPSGVQATVHHGHVTLTGKVEWAFQREAAEKAVRYVPGVVGVDNHIQVTAAPTPKNLRSRIREALHRNADVNAHHIEVAISGGVATLTGNVASWTQRQAAERAAADAPGVIRVDNRLEVMPAEF